MASAPDNPVVPRVGRPAPIVRTVGWVLLAGLAAFLVNNVLQVGLGFPVPSTATAGGGALAWLQLAFYAAAVIAPLLYVLKTNDRALRFDAAIIHRANLYLVRACFWSVLLIGIADSAIAFMRVEGLLVLFMASDSAALLDRAWFLGYNIHLPLIVVGFLLAAVTRTLGFTWLALLIVLAELGIVISRFVFSYEQALMGDLVRYWYSALFLFASAYTLFDEGHVRVDVLYAGFPQRTRGFVNAAGALLLGMTTCWVIIWIGLAGPHAIINSPVANFEITASGTVGMFVKYQMAAFLAIFAITMLIQFVSYLFEAVADYRGEPGHLDHEPMTT